MIEEVEDLYGAYDISEDFMYLNNLDFYNFFQDSQVDIPVCLRRTFSVRRAIHKFELIKFNNYLMRKGLRYRSLKLLLPILYSLQGLVFDKNTPNLTPFLTPYTNWRSFYLVFTQVSTNLDTSTLFFSSSELIEFRGTQTPSARYIYNSYDVFKDLLKSLVDLYPIFNFYIYKVDKRIYKNTRGKSGKHTFIWKYVTPYKRFSMVLLWLVREVRGTPGRSFSDRIKGTLLNFQFTINKT